MSLSGIFGRLVALIGAVLILWRRRDGEHAQAVGNAPAIPTAKPQGIPTLKMPTAKGWEATQTPVAASGLQVNAFARGLKHPRWIHVLPTGDVLVAEALTLAGSIRTPFDYAMFSTMKRAAAVGESPNRITLLRDADGDGVAEKREVFLDGLNQPFGMALLDGTFYVGNTDGVVAFPYEAGTPRVTGPGRKLAEFKPGGHWTRSLLASPDGQRLYVGVGSLSNIADQGMAAEEGRAAIWEVDLASGKSRVFAGGLRNPVGLAWEPQTGALWTVVNERDGLGDETPPDYLTSVRDGGFYGWPYCYWGQTVDDRVPQDPDLVAKALTPDYALGRPHCLARPVLASRRDPARLPGRYGHWSARLVEPQHTQRLQGGLRAVRGRSPRGTAARYPDGVPGSGRAGVLWPPGRGHAGPGRLAPRGGRCGRRDLARHGQCCRLKQRGTDVAGDNGCRHQEQQNAHHRAQGAARGAVLLQRHDGAEQQHPADAAGADHEHQQHQGPAAADAVELRAPNPGGGSPIGAAGRASGRG